MRAKAWERVRARAWERKRASERAWERKRERKRERAWERKRASERVVPKLVTLLYTRRVKTRRRRTRLTYRIVQKCEVYDDVRLSRGYIVLHYVATKKKCASIIRRIERRCPWKHGTLALYAIEADRMCVHTCRIAVLALHCTLNDSSDLTTHSRILTGRSSKLSAITF